MPNYQLSKIYKIVPLNSEDDSDIYIGSTTKSTLAERMAEHRSKYRHWLEGISKVSSFRLFDKYGLENCYIFLIEEYPCNTKDELRAREGHFIITTPCINKNIAGRTDKRYREDNKEKIKQYRDDNKEKIKQYRDDNKEKMKQYREDNKEKLNQAQKEKFRCICGGKYTRCNKKRHQSTTKHIKFMTKLDQLMIQVDEILNDIKKFKPIKK